MDGQSPSLSDGALGNQHMGIYASDRLGSRAPFFPSPFSQAGVIESVRWTLTIEPGVRARGSFSLVMLETSDKPMRIATPVTVYFLMPPKADLVDPPARIRVGSRNSCASWFDGTRTHYVKYSLQRSSYGDLVASCQIPRIAAAEDLFFELYFSWHDETYVRAGWGRARAGVRSQYFMPTPSDIRISHVEPGEIETLQPTNIVLRLPPGEKLVESFPGPNAGSVGTRSWYLGPTSGDLEYSVERPADRSFLQPTMDVTLLIAGVLFGLIPAVRRPEVLQVPDVRRSQSNDNEQKVSVGSPLSGAKAAPP
jgi:hypothetical protein